MASAELEVIISGKDRTKGVFQSVTGSLQSLGRVALGVGAAGVAAVGASVVKATSDFVGFEQSMNEVFTLLPNISQEAMDDMTGQVKDFSTEFGVLPEEVVPALYQALSAGIPPDNVFSFMETAQKAATAGVADTEVAVDALTSVVNAYGEDVISSTEASDIMFTAVKQGKLTFDQIGSSISNVLPLASAVGIEFDTVAAGMATMTSQGIPAAQTTTQLRQLMTELSKSGTQVNTVFQDTAGVGFTEFIAQGGDLQGALGILEEGAAGLDVGINELFGSVEAGSAALALTGSGAETFNDNLEAMKNSAGATDTAFEQMNGSLQATINRIKATGKVALLDFAEAFSPLLEKAADLAEDVLPKIGEVIDTKVVPFVEKLVSWITVTAEAIQAGGIQQLFTVFEDGSSRLAGLIELFGVGEERAQAIGAAISNVIGPVVEAIGQFVSWKDILIVLAGAIAVGIAIIVGPLVIAIAKITLIIAGVVAVVKLLRSAWENNWGDIQGKTQHVWNNILKPAFQAIREWLAVNIPKAIETVKAFWEGTLKPALQALQAFIVGTVIPAVAKFVSWLQDNIPRAIAKVQQFWEGTLQPALAAIQSFILNTVVPAISSLASWLSDTLTSAFTAVSNFWTSTLEPALSALWSFIQDDVTPVVQSLSDVIQEIADLAFTAIQGAWENILKPALESLWGWLQDKITPAAEGAKGILEEIGSFISATFGPAIQGVVDGALGALKGVLDGIKSGLQGVKNWLDNVKAALQGVELPPWLTPGSPSPFEQTLINSAAALRDINREMGIGFAFNGAGGRRGFGGQAMTTVTTNNVTLNINTNASSENVVGSARMAQSYLGGI